MRSGSCAVASSILRLTLIFLAATCAGQTQPTYPPVFNVAAPPYNVDPTGNTDATTAVKNACTAANVAGGGIIYFPAGLYWVDVAGTTVTIIANTNNSAVWAAVVIGNPI